MNTQMHRRNFLYGAAAGVTGSLLAACDTGSQTTMTPPPTDTMRSKLRLVPGGYSPQDFANFIRTRFGTSGDPVYWYGVGDASTFPDGKMFMRTEGYDTGRLLSLDTEKSEAVGLTRKMIVLRDPSSGEILKNADGKPAWLNNFTYQLFNMRLQDGFLVYDVEAGAGQFRKTVSDGLNRSEVQHYPGMTIYTTPVNYSMPDVAGTGGDLKVWENYDFIERDHAGGKEYAATWAGAFPLPPMMGPGRSSMHGYFQRYDRYEDVPATLRAFVEEYAPLWKAPPVDMDEIRSLQN
jgi:hypothetical protein